jgi:hypothetical protein
MDLETPPPKTTRTRWIVRGILLVLGTASVGFWAYGKYLAPKSPLGGPCTWEMHCSKEAPRCMKESATGEGVCSRACEVGQDCAEGIRCISVELDERDETGKPLSGGYCVPQALVDKKRNKPEKDGGAATTATEDGWLPIPRVPGQFEGELVVKVDQNEPHTVLVKGSLTRLPGETKPRVVVDAAHARLFVVDDEKKTFHGQSIEAQSNDVSVDKTTEKDTVAGIDCVLFRVREPHGVTEACVVSRGSFADPKSRAALLPWQKELASRGAIPLRATRKDSSGKETSRFVVVSLAEKPLDASLFAIPKSYRNVAQKK